MYIIALLYYIMSRIIFTKKSKLLFEQIINSKRNEDSCYVDEQHQIKLIKKYYAIHDVITSLCIVPKVIEHIINTYIDDVLEFTVFKLIILGELVDPEYLSNSITIRADNVNINFISYSFTFTFNILSRNIKIDNENIFKILGMYTEYATLACINHYMKRVYNKHNYISNIRTEMLHCTSKCNSQIIYKYKYTDMSYAIIFNIQNHRMLKNMIIILRLFSNIISL